MKEFWNFFNNIFFFVVATAILGAAQVSLWLQLFGYFPPPNTWIPGILFMSIFRRFGDGIFTTAILAIAASTLTATPIPLFLMVNIILFISARYMKHRIYWTGPTYFMMVSAVGTVAFHFTHLCLSWVWETKNISHVEVFEIVIRSLMTALLALPLYYLFRWIDLKTSKKQPSEAGNLLYG